MGPRRPEEATVPNPEPLDSASDRISLERYQWAGLVFMVLLIIAFPWYRSGEPERRAQARAQMHQEDVRLGKKLYALHCASCHGEGGRGGASAPALVARDALAEVSDKQLELLISVGIPGSQMPAYEMDHGGPLTPREVEQVVTYLRSLKPTQTRTASSGVAANETRVQGAEIQGETAYAAHCAGCHGPDGQGTSMAGPVRPPPAPLDEDASALMEVISKGISGTAMPAFAEEEGGPLDPSTVQALSEWLQTPDSPGPRAQKRP